MTLAEAKLPKIVIVLPCYNEEAVLPRTLKIMRDLYYRLTPPINFRAKKQVIMRAKISKIRAV